ncbi:MAG TPA: FAD-dependent monooxygenase [Vicinamibacterales bacterium]|nr:FAD-dependent monooxygenase [Vicinamibacterales bacterium]
MIKVRDLLDVLIVGGGPAGAIAGLAAARAGARVRILERAAFPRDKLCGDTVNPGALSLLERLGVSAGVEAGGLPVEGMVVTGEGGVRIAARYPSSLHGRAILRRDFDWLLLQAALAAGCELEERTTVRGAIVNGRPDAARVVGVEVGSDRDARTLHAPVVIGADGRRSRIAFGLGLARHPPRPRRWAVGAYLSGVTPPANGATGCNGSDSRPFVFGEMHVRRNCYIGVAPVPGGLTNVCLVRPAAADHAAFQDPATSLTRTLAADPILRDRFATATLVTPPAILGPLAVDATGAPIDGLLLAGDAAGFVDPMTGDGLRFAIRGGELAAAAALQALEHGWAGVHASYAAARTEAFASKWRFNRALRAIVASPASVSAGAHAARLIPTALRWIVARAGDCHVTASCA